MDSKLVFIRPILDAGYWLPHPEPYGRKSLEGGFFAAVSDASYLADWLPHPDIGGPGPQPPFPPKPPTQPVYPSHPIFYPPGTSPGYPGWGGDRPHPEFPIAGPPWFPQQPTPPGGGGGEPPTIGGGPILPPGTERPPIGGRPPTPPKPTDTPPGYEWVYVFIYGYGYMWVLIPVEGTTPPEGGTPPEPDQGLPPGEAAVLKRSR